MTTIASLPNEILLDLFERLNDAHTGLLSTMRTCRRWYRLGATVLYTHISMDTALREDSACARFSRHAGPCHLIRSFSVRVTQVHLMGFGIVSADAFDRLTELCDALSGMQSLKTFALSFEEAVGEGFTAPSGAIVSILKSLPKTVVDLNLDCECMSTSQLGQPHVCHTLSVLLPRLRSLRLRTSHFCSGLLSSISPQATFDPERPHCKATWKANATSPLQYLLIRLITSPEDEQRAHTTLCYTGDKMLYGARLADTLHGLYTIGAFPLLQQFAIIGRVDAPPSPRNNTWNVFKIRSFNRRANTTTTTLPWCARGGSSSLYMVRDSEEDRFGSFGEVVKALEGPLAWTNAGIKPRRRQQDNHWELNYSNLSSRKEVMEKFGVSFRLWKHEREVGMKLLQPRTSNGFDDTTALVQDVPPEWRWIPEGPWNWTIAPLT
ncbi:hypothetical protein P280DRAFT_519889 [Massarina eburnea CBS 473.64]|uniref:F-box domain-containing protein n=1 Tax=Massarina eburnea CBS 473.64 TaxID=1395130 RepID=A0A6A6RWC9_9PLEO|nr:hypothetical protein P280DRAFT_519889 [Massarina eburnea CBS 473.64]